MNKIKNLFQLIFIIFLINESILASGNTTKFEARGIGDEIWNNEKHQSISTSNYASNLTSGLYIYKLTVNNFISTKKMLLAK